MSRRNLTFVCQNCGGASPRWVGKCEACGEWNTLVEEGDGTGIAGVSQADMLYDIVHGWRAVLGDDRLPFIYIRKDQYNPIADVTARLSGLSNTWMVDNEGLRHEEYYKFTNN